MLRPYILCRHTAYVGTHRRPQCAPACSPSSLPSAPRVLEEIRPSPPPTATRSPSASGIRSSRSRGSPEQALIYGWPVDLGPFAGVGASRVGDSLVGAILFDSQLGVQVRPGVTARFVAGRARREAP